MATRRRKGTVLTPRHVASMDVCKPARVTRSTAARLYDSKQQKRFECKVCRKVFCHKDSLICHEQVHKCHGTSTTLPAISAQPSDGHKDSAKQGGIQSEVATKTDCQQQESVRRLQSELRNNWSKLVTDKISALAFAKSLKGHKCPTLLFCQS